MKLTGGVFFMGLFVVLVLLAWLVPGNPLTGNVVSAECRGGDCLQLCDGDEDCSSGSSCCPTLWNTGMCALPSECDNIYDHSKYDTAEGYRASIEEQPDFVQNWTSFFAPIVLVFVIIIYFVLRRNDPHW